MSTKTGVLMATDEINQAGGINGRKIQIIVEDDQGRPEQAATALRLLNKRQRAATCMACQQFALRSNY